MASRRLSSLLLVGVLLSAIGLAACSKPKAHLDALASNIDVSISGCGRGWQHPQAGQQSFQLHDSDTRAAEVSLVDPSSGAVYAAVEPLAAGRTAAMTVQLAAGRYAFRCAMEDEDVVTGPSTVVPAGGGDPGTATNAPKPVRPVTQADLIPATKAYTGYVTSRLPVLSGLVSVLQTDLTRRELAKARVDWLAAHLEYERLGAAYGAFGHADGAINGMPNALPRGVNDQGFTGFHRIEYELWHGSPASTIAPHVAALAVAVTSLAGVLASAQIDPAEVSIRAHEITENALQFELTGHTDLGSHSALATVRANLDGTRQVLKALQAVLVTRFVQLPELATLLNKTQGDLDRQDRTGSWTALAALSRSDREDLDADISQLSELLASVASICEPRRTP